ncbi:MAG: aspartate kinase, partial [Niameybacter sp.]
MNIIIQKFGGTSVATPEARAQVVQKIVKAKQAGKTPIVVVSAMGRAPSPYATDTLLQFVKDEAG